ncbi:tripartite motif-containing protein 54-like isoform X1 [Acipenser oxyrinchus oxyrinchus]|uniref:RING-type E3 ubiquitin transferase n=1 Tax=Acipenser oxyrinchus oxyrinchus TaxID=40147 RepID=A0AAD8CS18_ACIOX|nr:tripartite motif-containing protein 54-like isoform X1 [Acipenser oxyrinchus oxyrinchus]
MEYSSFHGDQAMDSLERQLICPVCLELLIRPVVILPCQHNLCRKCANDIFQLTLFQARGTLVGTGGRFRCPSCCHEVVLDRHRVYGLQRNLLVESIIDVYKQESSNSRPRSKPAGHLTCEEHEEEKMNIYCISCQVPTCSLCKVFGTHKHCQVTPLPDGYKKQKSELSDGISCLIAANDRAQAVIAHLEDTCRNVEDNCKRQKQTLCEKFDRMNAILEERQKIMVQRITYEQEEKTGYTRSLMRTCMEHIEATSKQVETRLQAMEVPQMIPFMQVQSVCLLLTFSRMSATVKDSTLEELQSGYETMDHYPVDFSAQERALSQLDFVKIVIFFSVEQKNDDVPEEEPEQGCGEDSEDTAAKCAPLKEADEGRAQAESSMGIKKEEAADTDGISALQAAALFLSILVLVIFLQGLWRCIEYTACTYLAKLDGD